MSANRTYGIEKTTLGYYSVTPLPSSEELGEHYKEKYYQHSKGSYSHTYSAEEITFFLNDARVAESIIHKQSQSDHHRLFDIGSGEGFFARHFQDVGWDIVSADFSSAGMEQQNPGLLDTLIQGDIFETIDQHLAENKTFELLNLKNVLEHVIDPVSLLTDLKPLVSNDGLVRVTVPNDYSLYQTMLTERELTDNTWFTPPEHLHYFNVESLQALFLSVGYEIDTLMTDFPIELFISNQHSNYAKTKNLGKQAHFARVMNDNFIFEQGIDNYVRYYSACANVNIGRQVIIYARPANAME